MMLAAPLQTSLAVLEIARAGRFAEIHDLFGPQLGAMVSAEPLQAAWEAELGRRGPVSSVGQPASEPAHAGVVVVACDVLDPTALSRLGRATQR